MFEETVLKQVRATLIWRSGESVLLLHNRRSVSMFELMVSLQQGGDRDGSPDGEHTTCYNGPWRIAPFGYCTLTLPWKEHPIALRLSYHQGDEARISIDYAIPAAFSDAWFGKSGPLVRCHLATWNPGARIRASVLGDGYSVETLAGNPDGLVLVLGKDTGSGLNSLRRFQRALAALGYFGVLLKDLPDGRFCNRSIEEKATLLASMASVVLIEDSEPAGQIAEMSLLARNRCVIAVLRRKGTGSTWVTGDYHLDFKNVAAFEYPDGGLYDTVAKAMDWAERRFYERQQELGHLYVWRRGP